MRDDPKGYYARLGVDPQASRAAINAAYRRKARVLHPDVPVTGNAQAFIAMKEAYEVLADPLLRGAYDRTAQPEPSPPPDYEEADEILAEPPPPMRPPRFRQPRITAISLILWALLGGLVLLAGLEAVTHLSAPPDTSGTQEIPATAPTVAPAAPPTPTQPVRLAGTPNAYVMPAVGAAVVWRLDPTRHALVPLGRLPSFSAVQIERLIPRHGMAEIRLGPNRNGFIDASRLTPGNAEAAHQAFCAYNAGPEPDNGELLARHGSGPVAVTLVNRSSQPTVVKLRTQQGVSAATVYLTPNGKARVSGLPAEMYRPEYAIGELWSRACGSFAAGMRSQRFPGFVDLSAASQLSIPPDLIAGPQPVDISDREFERR